MRDKAAPHILPLADDMEGTRAVQAVGLGVATPEQQKMAIKHICYDICQLGVPPYMPGDDNRRNTDILIGMQCAAHEILKRVRANLTTITEFANERKANARRNRSAG